MGTRGNLKMLPRDANDVKQRKHYHDCIRQRASSDAARLECVGIHSKIDDGPL